MIWTFKIELLFGGYAKDKWQATIEIDSESTLESFHLAIQDAVEFENDHLYEFYISKTERSRDRIRFDDDDGGVYDTTLESIYPLEKGRKLYYMFDYGDSWLFKITKAKSSTQAPKPGINYPRVVSEAGNKPEQYPEWDE
jgi:hypothetical protein